ncbi:glycosyltransferase [Leptolyngbya sp. FACHB-671]|uniref:glycosyltransferase family 2 protein n=1 Tax=Leptolyngbya sp. FACHB-671 TaxID=2692812 RepID=UPI001687C4B1|nr:glycosyltransferase [Leptolyngbya sp. FACHB-671]MBD2071195.1 glycosyltransferase [Leptolyngbya sp. FACHB-671]
MASQLAQRMPLVSVVIPTYNCDRYIVQAIESVLNQTYSNSEIIVVDDGSTDQTQHVLKPYLNRIRYIHQENQGVSAARNLGIQAAKGEFVAFLDADDFFLPDKLADQVACFEAKPSLGVVSSGWYMVDEQGKDIIAEHKPWLGLPHLNLETWLLWRPVLPSALMLRRKWLEAGAFDTRLSYAEDAELLIRLAAMGCESAWIEKLSLGYRRHSSSATSHQNVLKQAESFDAIYESFFAQPDLPKSISKLERAAHYNYLVWLGWRFYQTSQLSKMSEYLRRALLYSPYLPSATVSNWVQSFSDYALGSGEELDAHALSNLPEWKQLTHIVLTQKTPRVSVIIPAYNCAEYIAETIESVLNQTYSDYEIIVVDDGSTDATREVAKAYGDRLQYVYQQNQGAAAARNRGMRLARGELIAFLDGDDLFSPDKLAVQVAYFDANPSVGMVKTGWQIIDQQGKFVSTVEPWHYAPKLDLATLVLYKVSRPSALMVHRDWCERTNGFNTDFAIGEDLDWMLRLALMGCEIVWVRQTHACYRQHSDSLMSSGSRLRADMENVMDQFFDRADVPDSIRQLKAQERYQSLVWIAWRMYRDGCSEEMATCLEKSLNYTSLSSTETVLNWINLFTSASAEYGYELDVYSLINSSDWQRVINVIKQCDRHPISSAQL